eukprot:bmy_21272T0
MPEVPAVRAWPLLLSLAVQLGSAAAGAPACPRPAPRPQAEDPAIPENVSPESSEMTQEQLLDNFHLMVESSEDLPILWNAISNYESMKALETTDIKNRKEPCQRELYQVLDRLAREQQKSGDKLYKFYLPNCNKNGFYHSKQGNELYN